MSDISYSDLIKEGIVKNEKGECYAPYNGENSITHCIGVKSERGLYRVWISNLQKMIRRGKMDEAITSMIECVETGSVFRTNVLNRLCKVIVSEDIGLAYPTLPIICDKYIKKEITNDDLLNIVSIMVKSPKSRLTDDAYFKYSKHYNLSFEEAFKNVKYGIKEGNIGKVVSNINNCIDVSKGTKKTIKVGDVSKRQEIYEVWKYILSLSDGIVFRVNIALLHLYVSQEGNDGKKLNMLQAVFNIMLKDKIDWSIDIKPEENLKWVADSNIWPWSISYDKHCIREAYKLGRDLNFFFEYGAYLENEKEIINLNDNK